MTSQPCDERCLCAANRLAPAIVEAAITQFELVEPPPKPDHDHTMTVEFDEHRFPRYRLKCAADASSLCRAVWKCGCEEIGATGIDEQGPWHELTEGYMTYEEMRQPEPPRHYGDWGGDCTYDLWVNASECADETGKGSITFPITLSWDGDGYTWEVAK